MTTIVTHLALVSETQLVPVGDLMKVAAALQKQASRDLGPIWQVSATVDAYERLEDVQLDYWPMIVRDDIGIPGAAGVHLDENGQPYALISASSDIDEWSLTASHEALEMLVDPFGDRLVAGDSPKSDQGRVLFLVEVCDPSEAREFGYTVNGVLVSDFYTPHYFDPIAASGVRYSYTGAIQRPRQVLRGGYLSWNDPVTSHWWQEIWFSGPRSRFRDLGELTGQRGGFRAAIDRITAAETAKALGGKRDRAKLAGLPEKRVAESTVRRAAALRREIAALLGQAAAVDDDEGRRVARRAAPDD